jgi:hypothetical protein
MLFSRWDDGPPDLLLPLVPLDPDAAESPVVGTAEVHGAAVDGGTIVPVVEGRTLWPAGRAEKVPPEIVRDLVNGSLPAPSRRGRRPR